MNGKLYHELTESDSTSKRSGRSGKGAKGGKRPKGEKGEYVKTQVPIMAPATSADWIKFHLDMMEKVQGVAEAAAGPKGKYINASYVIKLRRCVLYSKSSTAFNFGARCMRETNLLHI